ncbi:AAEL012725-PA [Aedes aegypti]|uniref:AAEL012725-PA n=1 Tax=Aedes aegypti TaxID=7159 RepID=Q16L92_AEDAE|nr:AAEL012725-PA [Aedes aegypti]
MESVAKGDCKLSPSASAKKLKQTRLPFQILSGSPVAAPEATKSTPNRKRKPSIEADTNRATKIGRTSEAKENVKDSVEPVVVLDEESTEAPVANDSAVVEIQEDDLSQTPTKKADESNGDSGDKDKDDRIMIKFPVGKKKARKSSAGDEGSAKKKVSKEKKKHRKVGKKNKEHDQEAKPAEESIVLDDSDISDAEKEAEKDEVKVTVDASDDKDQEHTEENDVKVEEKVEDQCDAEEPVKVVESTEIPEEKAAEVEKASDELTENETIVENTSTETKQNEQSNDAKKKVKDEAITPRRARLPRAASQKTSEAEPKNDEVTPKRSKSAKKTPTDKNSETKTPKNSKAVKADTPNSKAKQTAEGIKEPTEKVSKPTTGALDKMFAKIQTESKKKPDEAIEILKTPEKKSPKTEDSPMEVDQLEGSAVSTPATNAISVSICLDDSNDEKRKQKTAQAFQSFFVKKPAQRDVKQSDDENSMDRQSVGDGNEAVPRLAFMPFCVKGDMRLAPICRATLEEDRKKRLEKVLVDSPSAQEVSRQGLYLQQLKRKDYVVGKCDRTWTAQDDEGDEDDVMIVDDNVCHQIEVDPSAAPSRRYRAKFFLFEENRRPPYRGTWRKRSSQIKPRRPFIQDTKFFDYEVDSDDEWEEEEPGESLHGSDDEKDVDPEEDYEVDNDFFVPHGHLSDEEMQAEDDVMEDNSPETQKAKLKILQQEFAAEMKKKTEKIKPRLIGCLWENGPDDEPECSPVIWEILKARAMLYDPDEPISFTVQKAEPESNNSSPSKEKEPIERKPKQVKLVDEGVKELITLIHGSALNRKFLIKEFLAYWAKRRDEGEVNAPQYGQDSIRTKILEVASWRPCPDEGPMQNKMCWYVNKEALVKYGLTDLKIPTGWEFILKPIIKSKREKKPKKDEEANGDDEGEKKPESKKESPKDKEKNDRLQSTPSSATKSKPPTTPASSITKFTKKLSEDDKRKQFAKGRKSSTASPSSASKKSATTAKLPVAAPSPSSDAKPAVKKRVQLLMSVPRGQSINQTTKSNLISQFLAKGSSDSNKKHTSEAMEVDPPVASGNHGGQAAEPGEVIVLDE